jgi:TonB-dependent receptor
VEWYFADNAVIQGGVFYKDIKDPIADIVFENATFNGIFAHEATIPRNLDSGEVLGFEANYQQVLDMLPYPFDGFLVGANYTYVDSETELNGRKIPLTGTSENVFNAMIGYEKGPFSLRLAGVYRDEYLDEVSFDGEADRYIKEHFSLDFTAKYNYSERFQLFLEWVNITDEPYVAVFRTPDFGDRVSQYEEYSWTVNAGLRFTY